MQPRIAIPADTLTEPTNIINERNAAFAPPFQNTPFLLPD